jgi:hypothetical protein
MVHILTKETSSGLMPTTFSYKAAVKCATTADGTLATAYAAGQLVDGYTLITGDRILIKNQTAAAKNGVYTVNATGAPTRATDLNAATMFPGAVVAVEQGTVNADSGWVCTADGGITLETSDIPWVLFGGMKAGNGLTLTADVISIDTAITADLSTAQNFTKKNIDFAGATGRADTGLTIFSYGTIDAPKTISSGEEIIPFQMYMQSTTNASVSENSLINAYLKTENTTIDQPNRRIQNVLVNTKLNYDCFDAYAVQAHITVATEMKTTNANAHITGISGKAVLTAAATAGWVTAGLFIIEGAAAVTQMCHGISIVCEVGVTACQSLLDLYNDAAGTVGINYQGNFTKGIDFSGGTWSQGAANFVMAYGTAATAVSVTPTDTIIPVQVNVISIADHGTSGDETIGATYFRTATSTASQPNHQLATCMVRVKVANNIWDAYGVQSHLSFGNVTVETTGANAHLTAISGKVTFDTTTVTKGWVTAGLFIIEGAGTCSQMCHGVSIVEEAGSTGAQSMLHLNTDVGTTPYFSFAGADGTGKSLYTHTAAGTQTGTIKVLINGVAAWIPFMQAE